ncbi:MAG TPA: MotA/TolQ/ExbB proton channel family protein [Solirubrobacterales bacterium]|nr:MotA/TolQ/ExbB proton channel family protein [Solirubrobacterales bacterium]
MSALQNALPAATSDNVTQALSGLSESLEQPVHIGAVILLGLLALELGRLVTEVWRRRRPKARGLQAVAEAALAEPSEAPRIARGAPGPAAERAVLELAAAAGDPRRTEEALADFELRVQRRLSHGKILVRGGPALGLMGTLIPLAPGLSALGEGEFKILAADMQVAFAATVIGILVGTAAFALTIYRTQAYTEDLAALERAVANHDPAAPPHHRVAVATGEHLEAAA